MDMYIHVLFAAYLFLILSSQSLSGIKVHFNVISQTPFNSACISFPHKFHFGTRIYGTT